MAAASIVLGKYLAITLGPFRVSLENLPVLLAGILFGPMAGLIVGVVADLVGCILVGYVINPIITLGAGMIGLLSGMIYRMLPRWQWFKVHYDVQLLLAVAVAHLVGSCLIKTIGLMVYYDYPSDVMWLRIPLYAMVALYEFLMLQPMVGLLKKRL